MLNKTSLFTTPSTAQGKKEAYQRVLRLSPAAQRQGGSKRIGAIATSLAPEPELVIFSATSASPTQQDLIQRIQPPKEVEDVDITELKEGVFAVAYCTANDVYLSRITYDFASKKVLSITSKDELRSLYSTPSSNPSEKPGRSTIRYLRFLTSNYLLLLVNQPQRSGTELLILQIHPGGGPGSLTLRKKLPSHMKAGVALDVSALDADRESGARQIAIAVGSQDSSIAVYTVEYSGTKRDTLSTFSSVTVLKDLHPQQMTKIALSPFHSPWPDSTQDPEKSDQSPSKLPGPQYLRLASGSVGKTIVVDTFPLSPIKPRQRYARYIIANRQSELLSTTTGLFTIALTLLIGLLALQGYLNAQVGGSHVQLVPQFIQDLMRQLPQFEPPGARVGKPLEDASKYVEESVPEAVASPIRQTRHRLRDVWHLHRHDNPSERKAVIVRPDNDPENADSVSLSTELHPAEAVLEDEHQAKKWEELSEHQQQKWKQRLLQAGEWVESEGESVLKGIFFSEVAGIFGGMAQAALNG